MRGKSFWAGVAVLATGLIFVTGGGAATMTTVTLTVNSTTDSTTPCTVANHKSTGTCTLRGAILYANNLGNDNTMFVIKLAAKTYHLSQGALDVDGGSANTPNIVQIVGKSKTTGKGKHKKTTPASIIDGSGNPKPSSVFIIDDPTQISNVVITGGTGSALDAGRGGGLFVDASLDLENSVVQNNTACDAWTGSTCTGNYTYGGGIYLPATNAVALTLYQTTVTHNTGANGGGIAFYDEGSNASDTILLLSSHIDKNVACDTFSNGVCVGDGDGGGIWDHGEITTLDHSTVNGNIAGSRADGSGDGGGIYQSDDALQLTHSAVSGNVAGDRGGGIASFNHVDLANSVVTHNAAGYEGGGVYADYLFTSSSSTISSNTAGGAFACTVNGGATTCQSQTKVTSGTCATLYPSATKCTSYDGYGGGVFIDYEYSQFIATTVSKNLAVSLTGDSTDCSSSLDYYGGQGGGVFTGWVMTATQGSKFTDNTAACGGGIFNAVYNGETYTANLADSTVSGNRAVRDGGGIWTFTADSVNLHGMTVTKNHAGRQTGGVWDGQLGSVLIGGGTKLTKNTSPGSCKNITWPCS